MHCGNATHDDTPKGIWIGYLQVTNKSPMVSVLENKVFPSAREAEEWAKRREKETIAELRSAGVDLFNHGCWWNHPDRISVPLPVRFAWSQLHAIYFRLRFWLSTEERKDSYIEVTQFQAVRAIEKLNAAYPGIEIYPASVL